MSRSRKKTPIHTIACCSSQKEDKTLANRKFRRMTSMAITNGKEPPLSKFQAANPWDFVGDGKRYNDPKEWGDERWRLFNK